MRVPGGKDTLWHGLLGVVVAFCAPGCGAQDAVDSPRGESQDVILSSEGDGDAADSGPAVTGYSQLFEALFRPGCALGACHDGEAGIAGLSFADLDESYAQLVGGTPSNAAAVGAGLERVAVGEPERSLLWRKLSESSQALAEAGLGAVMPLGGLAGPDSASMQAIEAWIAAGAPMDGQDVPLALIAPEDSEAYVACDATEEAAMQQCFGEPPDPDKLLRLYTPPLEVPAGSDILICAPLPYAVDADILLTGALGQQMAGGHHVAVYVSDAISGETPHECGDLDMTTLRFVVGAGGAGGVATTLPPGTALKISKGQQIVIQSHYINTESEPRVVMDAVDLVLTSLEESPQLADAFAVLDSAFEVPPLAVDYESVKECLIDEPLDIHLMLGHTHDYGVLFQLDYLPKEGGEEMLYWATDGPLLRDNPEIKLFGEEPLRLVEGDRLRITCRWTNTTSEPLGWPEEMCVGFMYYTPSRGFLLCDSGDVSPVVQGAGDVQGCAVESDTGNDQGVGKFCTDGGGECADNGAANFCLAGFDASANYCSVILCTDSSQCGEGATCVEEGPGSACVPDKCL